MGYGAWMDDVLVEVDKECGIIHNFKNPVEARRFNSNIQNVGISTFNPRGVFLGLRY